MKIWASVILLALLASCVPCWNPVYTDNDLIFDPALVGSWGSPSDEKERWSFSKAGAKQYKLKQTDGDGRRADFDARLVRLGDYKFLDLLVVEADERDTRLNGWAAFSLVPTHLVLQVHEIGPKLKISAMNPDWVKEWLEKNPKSVEHRKISDERYVIMASTKDLQKFILQHADAEGLFGGAHELEREKE
jgi:hypothetical protein